MYTIQPLTEDDTPDWRDLHRNVVSQYAVHWEAIAAELGLEHYHIANISKDYHNRTEDGCAAMLKRWLNDGTSPTWGTLDDAIKRVSITKDYPDSSETSGMLLKFRSSLTIMLFSLQGINQTMNCLSTLRNVTSLPGSVLKKMLGHQSNLKSTQHLL